MIRQYILTLIGTVILCTHKNKTCHFLASDTLTDQPNIIFKSAILLTLLISKDLTYQVFHLFTENLAHWFLALIQYNYFLQEGVVDKKWICFKSMPILPLISVDRISSWVWQIFSTIVNKSKYSEQETEYCN